MSLIRSLFTIRFLPPPSRGKPASYNPIKRAIEYYKRAFGWIRRHWKLTLILIFVFPVGIGTIFRLTGAFDIYDYYGVSPVGARRTGDFWDIIWEIRGQPPGFETNPDGLWTVTKITGEGLNGPINPIFIPFEFWLVDLMIYVPAFFTGGIDLAVNWDLLVDYLVLIPFVSNPVFFQRLFLSAPLGILAALVLSLFAVGFILLIPLIIGFYAVPIIEFMWINFISLIKLIVLVSILIVLITIPIAILNPEALKNFLGG